MRSYFGLGGGIISASQLRGVTAGISTLGSMNVSSFYGKRNLEITSTTLATNVAAGGGGPWGGAFIDTAAHWVWRPGQDYQVADNLYSLFQIHYVNTTEANITVTLHYTQGNFGMQHRCLIKTLRYS
jgi:hypothetical protein